jgi:hypothetical protein
VLSTSVMLIIFSTSDTLSKQIVQSHNWDLTLNVVCFSDIFLSLNVYYNLVITVISLNCTSVVRKILNDNSDEIKFIKTCNNNSLVASTCHWDVSMIFKCHALNYSLLSVLICKISVSTSQIHYDLHLILFFSSTIINSEIQLACLDRDFFVNLEVKHKKHCELSWC